MAPVLIPVRSTQENPKDTYPTELPTNLHKEKEKIEDDEKNPTAANGEDNKTIKQLFDEFNSGLTLHGFRFLFEGSPLRRLLWFFITTTVFTFSVILFNGLFTDFLLRKTMVSSNTEFLPTFLDFPSIMVCPNNQFNTRKIEKLAVAYNKTPKEFVDLLLGISWNTGKYTQDDLEMLKFLEKQGVSSFHQFFNKTRITLSDMKDTPV